MNAIAAPRRVSWKSVALPAEHGGWGFTLNPIVLGLAVAPSISGAWLGVAALGGFLARHPLKLVLMDLRRHRRFPRTVQAAQAVTGYLLVALLALGIALSAGRGSFWPILALALPLGLCHLAADIQGKARSLAPELAGALALASLAPAIAVAAGWQVLPALGLWLVLAAHSVASITYVRYQVQRVHGLKRSAKAQVARWPSVLGWGVACSSLLLAAVGGLVPWLSCCAVALLGVRLLSAPRTAPPPARLLGWREIGFGAMTIALTALGFALGI